MCISTGLIFNSNRQRGIRQSPLRIMPNANSRMSSLPVRCNLPTKYGRNQDVVCENTADSPACAPRSLEIEVQNGDKHHRSIGMSNQRNRKRVSRLESKMTVASRMPTVAAVNLV